MYKQSLYFILFVLILNTEAHGQTFSSQQACQQAIQTGGYCLQTSNLPIQTPDLKVESSSSSLNQTLIDEAMFGAALKAGEHFSNPNSIHTSSTVKSTTSITSKPPQTSVQSH